MRVEVEADIDPDVVISQLSEADRREFLSVLEGEFGFSARTEIRDRIDRIKYKGLDTEKSTVEVLEEILDALGMAA